jgi:pilus assembly protein CpaF
MSNWAIILPQIRPLEPFLLDPTVTEIMVNRGGRQVYIERAGRPELVAGLTLTERQLETGIKFIAHVCGKTISVERPRMDARLEDGSRVAAIYPACSPDGAIMTIRKFTERYTLEQLVAAGTVPGPVATMMRNAIAEEQNILISGGTGAGKTTLLNALAATIPTTDRIILIEDTSEIHIPPTHHVVRLETRPGQEQFEAVTVTDLLKDSLRHRPDRILVGEVRGGEAWDLLNALNTGHQGSLSTIHANSAEKALDRLSLLVLQADKNLPHRALMVAISLAIHLVVHVARGRDGRRRVTELLAIDGYDRAKEDFNLRPLYTAPVLDPFAIPA